MLSVCRYGCHRLMYLLLGPVAPLDRGKLRGVVGKEIAWLHARRVEAALQPFAVKAEVPRRIPGREKGLNCDLLASLPGSPTSPLRERRLSIGSTFGRCLAMAGILL